MVIKYNIEESFVAAYKDEEVLTMQFNPNTASDQEFKQFMTWCYLERGREHNLLSKRVDELEEENRDLKGKVSDLEGAMLNKDGEIHELQTKQVRLETTINSIKSDVSRLITSMPLVDNRVHDLERYTRGFNLRFYNFPEEDKANQSKEDCRGKLQNLFNKVGFPEQIYIENAHRTGKVVQGKPRAIIARFNNRPHRKMILNKRKEFFNANHPVYEDLTQQDLESKSKHAEKMKDLYNQGKKTYFRRGNWYVDGRLYTPITNAARRLSMETADI